MSPNDWDVTEAILGDPQLERLLVEGWEPFASFRAPWAPGMPDGTWVILRRRMCGRCKGSGVIAAGDGDALDCPQCDGVTEEREVMRDVRRVLAFCEPPGGGPELERVAEQLRALLACHDA